jgi:hypothetical protein
MPRLWKIIRETLGWLFYGMVSPIPYVFTYKIVGGVLP